MTKRRNRKDCKYYQPRGKKTAYCNYLGNGLQCYKVCNMFVSSSDENIKHDNQSKQIHP